MIVDWKGVRGVLLLGALVVIFLGISEVAQAQRSSITPGNLYPGENVITVTAPAGVRSIRVVYNDSTTARYVESRKIGLVGGCPTTREVEFTVGAASVPVGLSVVVEQCDGTTVQHALALNTVWTLDSVFFPDAEIGEEVCKPFQIVSRGGLTIGGTTVGGGINLDSVSSPNENVSFSFSFPPPLLVANGTIYRYNVCFKAEKPGTYKFPVVTWIQRENPAGGYTNYPVADTGYIRVLEKRKEASVSTIEFDTSGIDNPPVITDPTTFRTIAVPNAVRPKRGKFFVGSYDLLGLVAGYAVADELLLFAGGAPPLPDDWGGVKGDMFGAFGFGAKVGTTFFDKLDVAAGYVYGQSILDKEFTVDELDSKIRAHVPWASISYGTDDARASVTAGYALKNHQTWLVNHPTNGDFREIYDTNAVFVAGGGDYRFARHWKVAVESSYMETVNLIPLIATARYFTKNFALDIGAVYAGLAINGAEAPKIPVVPMVSAVFVF